MKSGRLEAFSDGVIAIIITIAVLSLPVPAGRGVAGLVAEAPLFLTYAVSFVNVGLYWNNHHHLFQAADRIDGRVLWANLFMLFWLSLTPFVIRWLDEAGYTPAPTAAYGVVLGMAAVGWMLTQRALIACNGRDSRIARAIGRDRKGKLTLLLYVVATAAAWVQPWVGMVLYVVALLVWIVPDRRLERAIEG